MSKNKRDVPFYEFEDNIRRQECFARYKFVRKYVHSKKCLDLGCGARRGPYYLAETAQEVVGVDISSEAIGYVKSKWVRKNLTYEVMDGTELTFPDNSFDLVVSFEVIEHIQDYKKYLAEIQRVLRPEGVYILSTPNGAIKRPPNPQHIQEFNLQEFRDLLHRYFSEVEIYGQHRKIKVQSASELPRKIYYLTKLDVFKFRKLVTQPIRYKLFQKFIQGVSWLKKVPLGEEITTDDFAISKQNLLSSDYFIGMYRK